jgi:hypothetical protein
MNAATNRLAGHYGILEAERRASSSDDVPNTVDRHTIDHADAPPDEVDLSP